MLTFKEAFDIMTQAYSEGNVNPYDAKFCFCGNLCNNSSDWRSREMTGEGYFGEEYIGSPNYSGKELRRIEFAFMSPITDFIYREIYNKGLCTIYQSTMGTLGLVRDHNLGKIYIPGYDDIHYDAFVAALEVLADIHRERGEDIDMSLKLVKKQPAMA